MNSGLYSVLYLMYFIILNSVLYFADIECGFSHGSEVDHISIRSIHYFYIFAVVLQSLYCIDGEFKRLSEKIVQIQFEKYCFITFEIDEMYPESTPSISVSLELLPRNENDSFKQVTLPKQNQCVIN